MEPPLRLLTRAIQVMCDLSSPPTINLTIDVYDSGEEDTFMQLLAAVVEPLAQQSVTHLTLGRLNLGGQAALSPQKHGFSSMICKMAASLRSLELRSMGWLPCFVKMPALTAIRTVSLSHHDVIENAALVGRVLSDVIALIQRCPSVEKLQIEIYYPSMPDGAVRGLEVARLVCTSLQSLDLTGEAFLLLGQAIANLPCGTVQLDIFSLAAWKHLSRLLPNTNWLPCMRNLRIHCEPHDPEEWEELIDTIKSVRMAAILRHVDLGLHLVGPVMPPTLEDILQLVRETSQDLVTFTIFLPEGLVDFASIYRRIQTIYLPKCKEAIFEMKEDLEDDEPGTRCDAFAVLMRLLDAPVLETLRLNFTSPFSDYIPTLDRTIRGGAFPMLQRLEGRFCAVDPDELGLEEWSDSISCHRKTGLETACKARGIDLGALKWD